MRRALISITTQLDVQLALVSADLDSQLELPLVSASVSEGLARDCDDRDRTSNVRFTL